MVLKKPHENSHFLTSEFHSGCNKIAKKLPKILWHDAKMGSESKPNSFSLVCNNWIFLPADLKVKKIYVIAWCILWNRISKLECCCFLRFHLEWKSFDQFYPPYEIIQMYIPDSWIRRLNNINKPFQPKSLKFARELEDSCIRLGDSRIRKESCICIPASVNLSLQFGR